MDIRELKNYIYENKYVEQILSAIGCHHIKYHTTYWTCANKTGDNDKAIVVYDDEKLICVNYTRQMIKVNRATDIIDLVCYTNELGFVDAIKFLCEQIGISYYHDFEEELPESFKILKMLEEMDSNSSENEKEIPLKPIDEYVLRYYKPYLNKLFLKDHISYETQKEFEIMFDEESNRYIIPIRSELGDLVGIKGRYFSREVPDNENKYIYLFPCARARIIYGLYKTMPYIKRSGRIYVGEAEKFVQQLWSYGTMNSGATCGKEITTHQIELLVRLGVDIVFCFDKGVEQNEYERIADKFPENMPLYYMFDKDGILEDKESPSDDPEKWKRLVENNIYKLR